MNTLKATYATLILHEFSLSAPAGAYMELSGTSVALLLRYSRLRIKQTEARAPPGDVSNRSGDHNVPPTSKDVKRPTVLSVSQECSMRNKAYSVAQC